MSPQNNTEDGVSQPLSVHTENKDEEDAEHHHFDTEREKETFLTSNSTTSDEAEVVIPPDGGWGWVVVFASFMCNLIVDGIIFSFGMFIEPICKNFGVGKPYVALIGSLMSGFYLIVGPFASALANRYGFQLVAIVGSLLSATAFVLSYFATSYQVLYATFGVLGGIGFGLIYVPAVITVVFYFERWRALASGIAVCGSGIGTFLLAPLTSYFIEKLGWRETLLCQATVVLTCIIFAALFRPLKPVKVKDVKNSEREREMAQISGSQLSPVALSNIEKALDVSQKNLYPKDNEVYHTISIPYNKPSDKNLAKIWLSVPFIADNVDKVPSNNETSRNEGVYRQDMFFSASLNRLPQYVSRTSIAYNISVTKKLSKTKKQTSKRYCLNAIKLLSEILDFSLFRSISFLIVAFGGFLTMMGFYVPFMYLNDRAKNSGIDDKSAVFLISCIGIANTVGRVLCGVLSSFPGVDALFITNVALTIGGIATIFSGISMTLEYQYIYTAIFGLSISCFASLRSIVVVDLLGLEKLTNAFGILLLFQGVAAVIGAPLAGAFYDATGSYDASFYLSGGLILASAIICYPLNYVHRWETRRKLQTNAVIVVT